MPRKRLRFLNKQLQPALSDFIQQSVTIIQILVTFEKSELITNNRLYRIVARTQNGNQLNYYLLDASTGTPGIFTVNGA